jgi:PBP1b-binding outer membrane lipoprotein LpoB
MRAIIAVAALLLLAGCSEMPDNLFSFDSPQEDAEVPAAPQAAPQQQAAAAVAPNDSLCRAVAQQDATGNGFDQPTQQRVAQQSYAQCMALHGN